MELDKVSGEYRSDNAASRPTPSLATEQDLCLRWHDHHDIAAARQLMSDHQCLVLETARAYRGYGLPQEDLIGEGHIGLMRAMCRFNPGRRTRFATYAVRCVRAAIQEYIMQGWSPEEMEAAGTRKRPFPKLPRAHSKNLASAGAVLRSEHGG